MSIILLLVFDQILRQFLMMISLLTRLLSIYEANSVVGYLNIIILITQIVIKYLYITFLTLFI